MAKSSSTTQKERANFGFSMAPGNGNEYPLAYSDDIWDVANENTALAEAMLESDAAPSGSLTGVGQYSQSEINEAIAGAVNSSVRMGIGTDPSQADDNVTIFIDTDDDNSIEVYTKAQIDAMLAGYIQVQRYSNNNQFPATGQPGVLYVNTTNSKVYEWNGIDYKESSGNNADIRNGVMQEVNEALESITPIEITGNVTNASDEEDLTSVNVGGTDILKFKDKEYSPLVYSGMGRVMLRKNLVNGVNTLTQDMLYKGEVGNRVPNTNTIFVIQYDYDLNNTSITIPDNCVLKFEGGSLSNGTITLNGTVIESSNKCFEDVTISGTPYTGIIDIYDYWFDGLEQAINKTKTISGHINYIITKDHTFTSYISLSRGNFSVDGNGFKISANSRYMFSIEKQDDLSDIVFKNTIFYSRASGTTCSISFNTKDSNDVIHKIVGINIINCTFDGHYNSDGRAIDFLGLLSDIMIEKCVFLNDESISPTGKAVEINLLANDTSGLPICIKNCSFVNFYRPVDNYSTGYIYNNFYFSENNIQNCITGLRLYHTYYAHIIGNTFIDCGRTYIWRAYNVTNNIFKGCGKYSERKINETPLYGTIEIEILKGCFSNNFIVNSIGDAVWLTASQEGVFDANTILNTSGHAIVLYSNTPFYNLDGNTVISITNNGIRNVGKHGIAVSSIGKSSELYISGNNISAVSTLDINYYAIYINDNCKNVRISNNIIKDNDAYGHIQNSLMIYAIYCNTYFNTLEISDNYITAQKLLYINQNIIKGIITNNRLKITTAVFERRASTVGFSKINISNNVLNDISDYGNLANKPDMSIWGITDLLKGTTYYATDINKLLIYNGTLWIEEDGYPAGVLHKGTSAQRPLSINVEGGWLTSSHLGYEYFDTDLLFPIYVTYKLGAIIVWSNAIGERVTWGVNYNLVNVNSSNYQSPDVGKQWTTILTADEGYSLPATIQIKMSESPTSSGGSGNVLQVDTDYTYDNTTGEVVVLGRGGTGGVTGYLHFSAVGVSNI